MCILLLNYSTPPVSIAEIINAKIDLTRNHDILYIYAYLCHVYRNI